jgi:hypothetical protein
MRFALPLPLWFLTVGAAFAENPAPSALTQIPGFELKVLDRKLPLQIAVGDQIETREIAIWVHMPKKGDVPSNVEDLTMPDDLSGGTTVLPPPGPGFGLRALRSPYRESFTLRNGRLVLIDAPVFIYYPKVPLAATLFAKAPEQPPAVLQQQGDSQEALALKRYAEMFKELRQLKNQFADVMSIIPDGTAKERLRDLSGKLTALTARYDTSFAYNPDGSVDKNVP